ADETARAIEEYFRTLVSAKISEMIMSRTPVWNPMKLTFETGPLPQSIPERINDISTWGFGGDYEQYTLKYHLAENILLTSFYHSNTVSSCLQALQRFQPNRLANHVSNYILNVISNREPTMVALDLQGDASLTDCHLNQIDPEFVQMRTQLTRLLNGQMAPK
ncbi:MAG: hypothetical protein ACAH59_01785, partial [Pseudobdellovibrionaceae bacterium]